jgi:hypothetical protein
MGRQIYSLLLLTAQPPVRIPSCGRQGSARAASHAVPLRLGEKLQATAATILHKLSGENSDWKPEMETRAPGFRRSVPPASGFHFQPLISSFHLELAKGFEPPTL